MRQFILSCLLVLCTSICLYAQPSVINATIKGLGNDTVKIEFNPLSQANQHEETVLAMNNSFHFSTTVTKPTLVFIKVNKALAPVSPTGKQYIPNSKRISMVLLPGDSTTITGELNKYSLDYTVTGAAINKELAQHHKEERAKRIQYFQVESAIDSLFRTGQQQAIPAAMQPLQELKTYFRQQSENYLQQNPDKDYAALVLVSSNNPEFFGMYVNNIDERVKEGIFKDLIAERTQLYETTLKGRSVKIGTVAPAFAINDVKNKPVSLAAMKGKYVLLDFWGSWCIPCIKEIPTLNEVYKKYSKQLELVSIACNDTESDWKDAIKKHKPVGIQVLNVQRPPNNIAALYGVYLFPTKILIDPQGTIVLVANEGTGNFFEKMEGILTAN